jgi:NTP pyrophosphatase (non-canonical NTP hydrolase)
MNKYQSLILQQVLNERIRQDEKWGTHRDMSHFEWMAVIIEELGEVGRAMLTADHVKVLDELIQVTAVAVAWCENILEFGGNDGEHTKSFKSG